MGNCCCKPKPEQRLRNAIGRNQAGAASLVVVGTNKPLLEFYKYFEDDSHDEQSAREKLQKRSVFWETQPSYSGRLEIWQMLRMTCEADDMVTAQAIIDSESLNCPTGKLTDGVYDRWGNMYSIPSYCIGSIFVPGGSIRPEKADSMANSLVDTTAEPDEFEIKARFSNGAPDSIVKVHPGLKVSTFKRRLLATHGDAVKVDQHEKIQLVYMGKILENPKRISDYKIRDNTLIQVFIKS